MIAFSLYKLIGNAVYILISYRFNDHRYFLFFPVLLTTATATTGTSAIPSAPDGGALAYVLRTGFGSSQGSLLQMIEFSQQTVAGRNLLVCGD